MRTRILLIAIIVVFAVASAGYFVFRAPSAPPPLKANADNLKATIVTPHLEQEIVPGKNILWCSTFQLAWNELSDVVGGPVTMAPPSPMADILNKRTATKADLDDASYVAMAGLISEGIEQKIKDEMQRKFSGQAAPELLPDIKAAVGWATYGYFSKKLPFRHAFKRRHDNLEFQGRMVDSFGITDLDRKDKLLPYLTSQVEIFDYRSGGGETGSENAEFVIGLRTESYDDRLILAKIAPRETLAETIREVLGRSKAEWPDHLSRKETLMVPVLNFDITRDYGELLGRLVRNEPVKTGLPLAAARQLIHFKLDEAGATLVSESEGMPMAGEPPDFVPRQFVFNKPFLILLQRKNAKNPYFALWVDNAELLVSTGGKP